MLGLRSSVMMMMMDETRRCSIMPMMLTHWILKLKLTMSEKLLMLMKTSYALCCERPKHLFVQIDECNRNVSMNMEVHRCEREDGVATRIDR